MLYDLLLLLAILGVYAAGAIGLSIVAVKLALDWRDRRG